MIKTMKQRTATIKKTKTEKTRSPAGTVQSLPSCSRYQYVVAIAHGSPSPKKTFTEFDPVTLPIAASAQSEVLAAVILAKVSGSEVPKATRVIAVTESLIPATHPRTVAISPITRVTQPMKNNEAPKHPYPPQQFGGGIVANTNLQKMAANYQMASQRVTSSRIISSSLICGPRVIAILN